VDIAIFSSLNLFASPMSDSVGDIAFPFCGSTFPTWSQPVFFFQLFLTPDWDTIFFTFYSLPSLFSIALVLVFHQSNKPFSIRSFQSALYTHFSGAFRPQSVHFLPQRETAIRISPTHCAHGLMKLYLIECFYVLFSSCFCIFFFFPWGLFCFF